MAETRAPLPEVHLTSLAFTVGHWLLWPGREEFVDLDAPYQRGSVWTLDQRRGLIMSLYQGLPVGAVIVAKLPYDRAKSARIVDGKQRILTVRAFAADEFDVPRWWWRDGDLEPSTSTADVRWADLSRKGRALFEMHAQLPALEYDSANEFVGFGPKGARFRKRSEDEMLRAEAALYLLVNGAGTPQTDEDLDRAKGIAG